jgi:hypothetical protein
VELWSRSCASLKLSFLQIEYERPTLQSDLKYSEIEMSWISDFQIEYAAKHLLARGPDTQEQI